MYPPLRNASGFRVRNSRYTIRTTGIENKILALEMNYTAISACLVLKEEENLMGK